MTHFLWTPGDCLAAATPRGVIVTEAGHEDLCRTFWEVLSSGADLGTLLQTLTSAFAANLAALPGFAAIIHEGNETHLAVRGAFEIRITQPQGTISMSSGRVITWEEKRLDDVSAWTISTPGTSELPAPVRVITSGVVPVRTLGSEGWMSLMDEPTQVKSQVLPIASEQMMSPSETPDVEDDIHRTRAYPDLDEHLEILNELPVEEEPHTHHMNHQRDNGEPEVHPEETPEENLEKAPEETPEETPERAPEDGQDDSQDDGQDDVQDGAPAQGDTGSDEAAAASNGFFISEVPQPPTPTAAEEGPVQHTTPSGGFFIDWVPATEQENGHEVESQGDHDGHTIRSNRHELLRQQAQEALEVTTTINTLPTVNMIFALLCINGHANPTHVNTCLTCDATLGTSTTQVPQPTLGILRFSTGEVLPLDRDVIVGRRPAYRPQPGRPEAHVVPVPSPNQEISRTHCEVSINGWDVRVRDLGSNNGTFLHRPGQSPVRITDSSPSILRPGDMLDLGDGVTITMEAL